jgi:hypothetical protein
MDIARRAMPSHLAPFRAHSMARYLDPMIRTTLLLAFAFSAGACGGSDKEPKSATTTEVKTPDEKSEDNIQMSAGAPATSGRKASKPAAEPKPAEPKPAEPVAPATAPK